MELSRDDRIESHCQESARQLAERLVDLEDEVVELKERLTALGWRLS